MSARKTGTNLRGMQTRSGNGPVDLWTEVLIAAVQDAVHGQQSLPQYITPLNRRAEWIKARAYVLQRDRDFVFLCDALGVDVDATVEMVAKLSAKNPIPDDPKDPKNQSKEPEPKAKPKPKARRGQTFTHKGQTLTVAEWAAQAGMKSFELHRRLQIGWTIDRAITVPIKRRNGMPKDAPSMTKGVTKC